MKPIVTSVLSLFWICLQANTSPFYKYNELINDGYSNYQRENFELSLIYFDSAFQVIDDIPYHYFLSFSSAMANNNLEQAYRYLVRGTLKGLNITEWNTHEKRSFDETAVAKKFYQQKDSLMNLHFQSIDYNYYSALKVLKERDSYIGDESKTVSAIDSVTFEMLIDLSTANGYPTFEKTGYGYNFAWFILWNQVPRYPESIAWKKIIPLIQKEIENGKIDPAFFEAFDEEILKRKRRAISK